ncbi:dihydropteroate synthase [Candidatus Kinetoplastidibacterium galati]|uniref:Dihydropteroate synthase n=1 Tax=Candidatus Kinetoplastidibacterium galati TCC219 TaxID=1208921 RepID=M1L8F8_9PROT|nr:dihydropteroate synthase [Candidatus Kinetoplastibacterium galatii]AGF48868.1 dihydropteroate synthase [Candidatus Kinetoplastibacterium galatii TCC219]
MDKKFQCGRFEFSLNRPIVMGIINVTPDSFSDGGAYSSIDAAIEHAYKMIDDGVDILDIGGESSRPGSDRVSTSEELKRLLPLIESLKDCGVPLSVDTYKPDVMKSVIDMNVDMINDICGFTLPGSLETVSSSNCGLCVMYMNGDINNMHNCFPDMNVVREANIFFTKQLNRLLKYNSNIKDRIVLDPGLGFGKTIEQNYYLINQLEKLKVFSCPLMIGASRKSMIGKLVDRSVSERLCASVSCALISVMYGANIVRVHDVAETVDSLKILNAIKQGSYTHEAG